MKKDTFYITADNSKPVNVWDAVATYVTTYDTEEMALEFMRKFTTHTAIVRVTTYDDNIINDKDVQVVYSEGDRVAYCDLSLKAKLNCLKEFTESVAPYGEHDEYSISDIEESVKCVLQLGLYSIDKFGYWYNEDDERC